GLYNVYPGERHLSVNLRDLATRSLDGGFLLRTVESEDRIAFLNWTAAADEDLRDASVRLRKDRDGAEEQRHVARRGMVVEDNRDQTHRENHAAGDAPPQLVPD